MSEVKGSLLNIILVLMLFATVAGLISTAVTSLTTKMNDEITEVTTNLA